MMPPQRVILHIDMDAFFAQVEQLAYPSLRGKPLIVGGHPGERGVVATASYEARPFGIVSGMSLVEAARRCPQAIFVPCHPRRYLDLSVRILRRLLAVTPLTEMASIDEAYLDTSAIAEDLHRGRRLAENIQTDIRRRLQLSCSIGIGPNKLIAKMAAGLKKPGGICCLDRVGFVGRLSPERVTKLYGVGPSTGLKLERVGIQRVEQLGHTPDRLLQKLLGIWGPVLGAAARGEDESPVVAHHKTPAAKSLGHEHTLPRDVSEPGILRRYLLGICDEVASDLRAEDRVAETIHLKVRLSDFTSLSRQSRAGEPTASTRRIFRIAWHLLQRIPQTRPVRLLGVSVSGLLPSTEEAPQDLFEDPKHDALDRVADTIRSQFGQRTIRRAALLPEDDR